MEVRKAFLDIVKLFIPKFIMKALYRIKYSAYLNNRKYECNHFGVNIVGLFNSVIGLSQAARYTSASLSKSNIPYCEVNAFFNNNAGTIDYTDNRCFKYSINIDIFNPDIAHNIKESLGFSNWKNRYNIGYWVWELPICPVYWEMISLLYDEIWVPTTFVKNSFKSLNIPVNVIPYAIPTSNKQGKYDLESYDISDNDFVFLVLFDVLSFIERKNPYDSIIAFKKSVASKNSNVKLIIKVNNGHSKPEVVSELKDYIKENDNIKIINKVLTSEDMNSLLNRVDTVVSLHRSEGFGLSLAEAMEKGKPVIATNWSGNVDFMNKNNSCLVDYNLIKIKKSIGPYSRRCKWAQANTEQASYFINKLVTDRAFYNTISQEAKSYIEKWYSIASVTNKITSRIGEVKNKLI